MKAAFRGRSFSYIICNFSNLIYRQIFKYSQLAQQYESHTWKVINTQHADWEFLEKKWLTRAAFSSDLRFMKLEFQRNQVWDRDSLHQLFVLTKLLALYVSPGNFA